VSAYLVSLRFRIQPGDYVSHPSDDLTNREITDLVKAMLHGDADLPDSYELKIYQEVDDTAITPTTGVDAHTHVPDHTEINRLFDLANNAQTDGRRRQMSQALGQIAGSLARVLTP